ncbi:Gfo/Idh/MocA family protein [Feifania hominis]|uniref:Gfo/Idh/MocA family oxidoreductase n=1 Tax=Feifania hominis TaxID=2763660 RepID=A0A926DEI1_9FIRM|nr:Gfo/Idh/MocA family oxidoreductase [Feifania hominis]MBC8537143.1 Gfo/Idh/MocA family oxidoreductase [Feifania hominis]
MAKEKVGVIGCGMISEIYMKNISERFANMELAACADIVPAAAKKRAAQFGCRACSVETLLHDSTIGTIVNLTVPAQHAEVSRQALLAGKNVYTEKPLCVDYESGEQLLQLAEEKGLLLGTAPDCFLGAGLQTVRHLLDSGELGQVLFFEANLYQRGPEWFHSNPAFFYQAGAGPILDWGPYYAAAVIALLGPVRRVGAIGRKPYARKTVMSPASPLSGREFDVDVPTSIVSVLENRSGVIGNLNLSFDTGFRYWESKTPFMRIYCERATIDVPDLNKYSGPVLLRKGEAEFEEYPLVSALTENCRGLALSDMVHSKMTGRGYRADGAFGLHVSEILLAMQRSVEEGCFVELRSTCRRPEPLDSELIAELCENGGTQK